MKPINLVHRGFDNLIDEYWAEEKEAFLITDNMVVVFYEEELTIYKFPVSLEGRDSVDYCSDDNSVKRFAIHFDGITNWHEFDFDKPLTEIIGDLTK